MTHSLHRLGTKENLSRDYPLICMAAHGMNEEGAADKMGKFLEICRRHDPVNFGDMKQGNVFVHDADDIIRNITNTTLVQCVFNDVKKVEAVLHDLREADLGLSVVVSGLIDETKKCCQKVGLEIHTVSQSLGIWGKTSRLPSREILEITTMCGHGLTSSGLVKKMIEDIRKGKTSPQKASEKLAKPCVCGIFNTTRAAELLAAAAAE
ncbi:MAG: hypothetical protein QF594_01940 [Dehalococcoidales bacterium]|jgi:hypothetical protein|nr:hypothetical protein [Dehalococcoidales bacterium]